MWGQAPGSAEAHGLASRLPKLTGNIRDLGSWGLGEPRHLGPALLLFGVIFCRRVQQALPEPVTQRQKGPWNSGAAGAVQPACPCGAPAHTSLPAGPDPSGWFSSGWILGHRPRSLPFLQVADFASRDRSSPRSTWPFLVSMGCWLSSPIAVFRVWLPLCLSSVPFPVCHYYFSDNKETAGSRGGRQRVYGCLWLIKCLGN